MDPRRGQAPIAVATAMALFAAMPAMAPGPQLPDFDPLLREAREPSVAGVLALASLGDVRGPARSFDADLPSAVARAYAAYGLGDPGPEALRDMARQAAALPPGPEPAAARLLEALAEHRPFDRAGALGIARAADGLAQLLRGPPPVADGAGFLFRDPYDLVLVGGPGSDVYAGNALGDQGEELGIAPEANLLTVDLGGDDLYLNDAGGAATPGSQVCPFLACGNGLAAAATIDASGDDVYRVARTFGAQALLAVQGAAAYGGVGILVDLAGHDTYTVDVSITAEVGGAMVQAQGAGYFAGVGVLLDAGGDDAYAARVAMNGANLPELHAQGAASLNALGVLADAAGADRYEAVQTLLSGFAIELAQGAGFGSGTGLHLDGGGSDVRIVVQEVVGGFADQHAQGVSESDGIGMLVDADGDDVYQVLQVPHPDAGSSRIAQGEVLGHGFALLLDAGGTDAYSAPHASDGSQWTRGLLGLGADLAG